MDLLALYCLPAAVAFLSFILIMMRDGKILKAQRCFAVFQLIMALVLFLYAQYFNPKLTYSYWVDISLKVLTLYCAPVYFLFLKYFSDYRGVRGKDLLTFLPSIIYSILLLAISMSMTPSDKVYYMGHVIQGESGTLETTGAFRLMELFGYRLYRILLPVQLVLALGYGVFDLHRYFKMLGEVYTSQEGKDKSRITLGVCFSVAAMAVALYICLIPHYEYLHLPLTVVLVLLMSVLIAGAGYLASNGEFSAEVMGELLDSGAAAITADPGHEDRHERMTALADKLSHAMDVEELWKDPDLTIVGLSTALGTNRTYLSQAIHQVSGSNFSDFINRYRIEHAVKLMKSQSKDKIVLKNIAIDSGCGSLSTFTRNFKLIYHQTPTQWLENQ